MADWFTIEVYGQDLDGVESEGGWQVALRTNDIDEANTALVKWLDELGWDDVTWDWDTDVVAPYAPDEEPDDIDSDFGYDPYMGCMTYDC